MAYARLSPNTIGSVITYLEMPEPPSGAAPPSSPLRLERLKKPTLEEYRRLFRKVGQDWLWIERLILTSRELKAIIHDPAVEIFAVAGPEGGELGMVELDFRKAGECRIAYVGLVRALIGQGHGRWLLAQALTLAWRAGVGKVVVNTCTLDHPAALKTYLAAGFTVCGRAVGTFADPRLRGLLPREAAPHIPFVTGAEGEERQEGPGAATPSPLLVQPQARSATAPFVPPAISSAGLRRKPR